MDLTYLLYAIVKFGKDIIRDQVKIRNTHRNPILFRKLNEIKNTNEKIH